MILRNTYKLLALTCFLTLLGCSGKEDLKETAKSVVRILNIGRSSSTGSGFCIGKELIATNHHVIDGPSSNDILILAQGENEDELQLFKGKVEWSNKDLDLAIVRVSGLKLEPIDLSTIEPEKNSKVTAIGYPGVADEGTDTSAAIEEIIKLRDREQFGVISSPSPELKIYADATFTSSYVRRVTSRSLSRNGSKLEVIEHDVTISGGNSGGPLVDQCGRVIGVNTIVVDAGSQLGGHNFYASRITELIAIASSKNFDITTTDSACNAESNWLFIVFGGVLLLIIIGLAIAFIIISKKKAKGQSYTNYLSKMNRRPSKNRPKWDGGEIIGDSNSKHRQNITHSKPVDRSQTQNRGKGESNQLIYRLSGQGYSFDITQSLFKSNQNTLVIGRKTPATFIINNDSVSRQHAILKYRNNNVYISDKQSGNGTSLNGTYINQGEDHLLRHDDQIKLGDILLSVT